MGGKIERSSRTFTTVSGEIVNSRKIIRSIADPALAAPIPDSLLA